VWLINILLIKALSHGNSPYPYMYMYVPVIKVSYSCEDTIAPRTAETSLFVSKRAWMTAEISMIGVTTITIHHE
jgi:hypothetical protein